MTQTETEALIERISKLPEIEFAELLGGIANHMSRSKWNHLIDDYFDVDDYSEELEDAERALSDLEDEKDDLVDKIYSVIKRCGSFELVDGGYDVMQEQVEEFIDKIKEDLQ